ncbi:MAG: hypothetical protein AAF125_07195 [Chloroflexota bacterium]
MVVRVLLRVIWVPFVLLMATVVVIRAQPYTPPSELALLQTDGCAPPCIMGIVPGETTREQALHLLEENPIVDGVYLMTDVPRRGILKWSWANWKSGSGLPRVGGSVAFDEDDVVSYVQVPLRLSLAEMRLAYGSPQARYYDASATRLQGVWVTVFDAYPDTYTVSYRHLCGEAQQGMRTLRPTWDYPSVQVLSIHPSGDQSFLRDTQPVSNSTIPECAS